MKSVSIGTIAIFGAACLAILAGTMSIFAGWRPTEPFYFSAGLGLLMIVFGLTFTRVRPNGLYGVRTKWTLENPTVWAETHRVMAMIQLITGLVFVAAALLFDPALVAIPAMLAVVFSLVFGLDYSRRVAVRIANETRESSSPH